MSKDFLEAAEASGYGSEVRMLIGALDRINQWCCFATEEDVSAAPLALAQIGAEARSALAVVRPE